MSAKKKPAGQARAARKVAAKKAAKKAPAKKAAKPKVKPPAGRPTKFTEAIADEICADLSTGIPLAEICRQPLMPARRTVYDWMATNKSFSARIARAREEGYDAIAIDCLHIADDNSRDTRFIKKNGHEIEITDNDVIQRAKLRVETRLKLLAKWDPKRYGEKLDVTSGNEKVKLTVTIGGNVDD